MANFIKRHRTIKVLHLLRNYSALIVVFSSAMLVTATNMAVGKTPSGFLFDYLSQPETPFVDVNTSSGQENQKDDLAFAPLIKSESYVNPDANPSNEEIASLPTDQSSAFLADNGASLKDPEEDGGVRIYEVQSGDTLSSIALHYKVTPNTILWANDIDNIDSIMPGDKLFILPVAGLSYTVKSGDTIDSIAQKYKADKDNIIAFNGLPANGDLTDGAQIIIPGGEKEAPASSSSSSGTSGPLAPRQYATSTGGYPSNVSGYKTLGGKAGTGHSFPYGYCTWYVSQRRYVPWGGNAGTWLYNAKVSGYRTGRTPQVGAIMVSSESWWGHVAIVERVVGDLVTVAEMNYDHWGRVDHRTFSAASRVVKGYIY